MDTVEKVVYINLAHRTDRKQHIERELFKIFPEEKVIRFNAVRDNDGQVGCISSHIEVLKIAIQNNWKNCLIVEDDMKWENLDSGSKTLMNLINNTYDVIVLGGTIIHLKDDGRLLTCQTTTAFIVNNHYYKTLLETFQEGLKNLIRTRNYGMYSVDQCWKPLQRRDNWHIVLPCMCVQRPDYSDILYTNVNYLKYFKVENE